MNSNFSHPMFLGSLSKIDSTAFFYVVLGLMTIYGIYDYFMYPMMLFSIKTQEQTDGKVELNLDIEVNVSCDFLVINYRHTGSEFSDITSNFILTPASFVTSTGAISTGCRAEGKIDVFSQMGEIIITNFSILNLFNLFTGNVEKIDHKVNRLSFGDDFPNRVSNIVHLDNIEGKNHCIYYLSLVPTKYTNFLHKTTDSYQYTALANLSKQPKILSTLTIIYIAEPLELQIVSQYKPLYLFMSEYIGMFSGVYWTIIGLVTARKAFQQYLNPGRLCR